MAWTTPRTWVTGEQVTDTLKNEQLRDNLTYLKAYADREPSIAVNDVTGSRALDTAYQNSGTTRMAVSVEVYRTTAGSLVAQAAVAASDPGASPAASSVVAAESMNPTGASGAYFQVFFFVAASKYYRVNQTNGTLNRWIEWVLN